MQNLQIDAQRLWDTLMETARFGATAKGGIRRLTLSDDDRQVRNWSKAAAEAIGCTVSVDEVGNMFARRAGRVEGLVPLCMGSHLDTQPTGGKFYGARAGVLGALEAMRTLHLLGHETNAPIEVVNWTNEEGSRFALAMPASDFWLARSSTRAPTSGEGSRRQDIRRRTHRHRLSRHLDRESRRT